MQSELLLAISWGAFPTMDLRDTFAAVTLFFAVAFASLVLYVTVKCQVSCPGFRV
jgi:hypothetical protein